GSGKRARDMKLWLMKQRLRAAGVSWWRRVLMLWALRRFIELDELCFIDAAEKPAKPVKTTSTERVQRFRKRRAKRKGVSVRRETPRLVASNPPKDAS